MSHIYSFLLTHIVFSTKDRIALITESQMMFSYKEELILLLKRDGIQYDE